MTIGEMIERLQREPDKGRELMVRAACCSHPHGITTLRNYDEEPPHEDFTYHEPAIRALIIDAQ